MSDGHDGSAIRLVVFDWAGTTVDHGCFAPVRPFIEVFRAHDIELSDAQARAPMGLAKKDHLQVLFALAEIRAAWRDRHGRDWTEADVQEAYERQFMPLQLECVAACSGLIDGLVECVERLRKRGIKIGTSTGYFREAAELTYEAAARAGYLPDSNVCPADVSAGRPAPWMIYKNMERLGVYPPHTVVKVGDTAPDMGEGRNAGVWTVGVTDSSSDVGLTAAELARLSQRERTERIARAARMLKEAGAHEVMSTVAALPELLPRIEERLRAGERP